MAFPRHVHGKLYTVPKPRHLLLNPTLSHIRCHPCHPAAGAGKAQGWTRLPSPSLSPHLLPLTPATKRETQGQQSTGKVPSFARSSAWGKKRLSHSLPDPGKSVQATQVHPHGCCTLSSAPGSDSVRSLETTAVTCLSPPQLVQLMPGEDGAHF